MRQTVIGKETDFNYVIELNKEFILDDLQQIKDRTDDENNGIQKFPRSNKEIIKSIYNSLFGYTTEMLISGYSLGLNIEKLLPLFNGSITYLNHSWGQRTAEEFTFGDDPVPYFTYDQYWKLLTMLSLGVLLDIPQEDFIKLVKIREKVSEKDVLLDTIIAFRVSNYVVSEHIMQTNPYQDLSSMLIKKTFTIEALKKYLSKQWYKDNKQMYWFDYHKDSKSYFGYWSFESGALVKILGLDDSLLKDQKYYPYDMVHWQ
ncbi:PoNi-like cognate immunity protein [Capnocytophaga canimorsus]|uniref:PoNi-like cognate immunity protein n=1 Tax=Capnocytophaga canimorsus TaxID=28188 RepID=UPI001562ABFE|nr:PoNi-like cognate immunity protein [Capnocytophaga canimorsus]